MDSINKKLRVAFGVSLLLSLIILLIPMHWKLSDSPGYYLDGVLIFVLIPVVLTTLIWLIKIKFRGKNIPSIKKLNIIFYYVLFLSTSIFIIPGKYKIAIYGPNYLGWVTMFFVFLTILMFLWLLVLDIKNKDLKSLLKKVLIFSLAVLFCVVC